MHWSTTKLELKNHSTGAQAVKSSQAGLQERAKEALVDGIRKGMSKGRLQADRERERERSFISFFTMRI